MARFYGSVTNSRGRTATAQGQSTGQTAHIRGWHSGVRVVSRAEGDVDVFDVYVTGGSTGGCSDTLLGTLYNGVWKPA